MTEIPHSVLSEHFQERMRGRRLRSAVFLTYQFDPGFFEQEVLPVFIDIPLSHAPAIRLIQLEDALRILPGQVAVYYDANGLVGGDSGSAKLDIRRIPVQHKTGIFHPKNMLLLVEAEEQNEQGYRPQTLIIATMSANLTRSGWWENVEACHVEEIDEGVKTRLKKDLSDFLKGLRRKVPAVHEHVALQEILDFLKDADQMMQKTSFGQLHPHFYAGPETVADFLKQTAGDQLQGAYLEVISPYFDDANECKPLNILIDLFQPREVRVYLPRSQSGQAQCRKELFEFVRRLPNVQWGSLPKGILKLGRSEDTGERFVHAKVYRFFTQNPKREICFIGSANLTSAAHQSGGNLETGFLVDIVPLRRPDFWLLPEQCKPIEFHIRTEDEVSASSGGTRLNLRYHWNQARAEIFWDDQNESPELHIEARGIEIGSFAHIPSRVWIDVETETTRLIGEVLEETSLFTVLGDGKRPALLLVQEEGMSHKRSLLLLLSASDILRYWSLLTLEQRTAFIEARAPEVAFKGQGADLVVRARIALANDTVFDRFAGFFHAFACLERVVCSALESGNEKEADYRLFGKKYDSLCHLLDRIDAEQDAGEDVDHYVIIMCAKQLCQVLTRNFHDYWSNHTADTKMLENRFSKLDIIRQRLIEKNPDGFTDFLKWFDQWFLKRAKSVEAEV